jgi:hypothetical protein
LDKKTRGYIELAINDVVLKGDLVGVLKWVQRETSVSSFRDLTLGYMIGGAMSIAYTYIVLSEKRAITEKDKIEVRELIRERLPDFLERVEREMSR